MYISDFHKYTCSQYMITNSKVELSHAQGPVLGITLFFSL